MYILTYLSYLFYSVQKVYDNDQNSRYQKEIVDDEVAPSGSSVAPFV